MKFIMMLFLTITILSSQKEFKLSYDLLSNHMVSLDKMTHSYIKIAYIMNSDEAEVIKELNKYAKIIAFPVINLDEKHSFLRNLKVDFIVSKIGSILPKYMTLKHQIIDVISLSPIHTNSYFATK